MPINLPRNPNLTPRDRPIRAGEAAPDFTLLDHNRESVSLRSLRAAGDDVVLSFFPFAFTSVCGEEMACFTREFDRFADRGATVAGISCDSFAALKAWRERDQITIPLLADLHREVCRAYGFFWPELNVSSRGTVIVAPDGAVKWVSAREPGEAIDVEQALAAIG